MEKKVSIIVAIYKSEKFLRKLIDSIIFQSYKNLEIILVDDGSPDNSGNICDEYAKIDERIIVIHKENGGTCDARNEGLKKVTGEYVTIIDGDDWLEEDYIEYLLNIITQYNVEMAISDKIFTTRDRMQTKEENIEIVDSEEAVARILYPGIPIGPWSKMYSKKVIDEYKINFSVPWSGEGLYFSTMIAQYSKKIGIGHKKVYNYRLNNSESGLTKYNVIIGTNALWNIKNIKEKLEIKTNKVKNACDWHIWKNYHFVLKLIMGTNIKDNEEIYNECLREIKKRMFGVILKSRLTIKEKIKVFIISLFPRTYAKYCIKKDRIGLKNDNMN